VIFDLGATVESFYGTARYLVFYLAATVCGFMASTWWNPGLSVGASAGLFGLIGAMIALGVRSQNTMGAAMRAHYGQWAVWGLVMGLLPMFSVDNAAHLGGLAAGFILAYFAGAPRLVDTWVETFWRVAAGICVLVTAGAFALMFLNLTSAAG
jgi:rhomboid protease GluP